MEVEAREIDFDKEIGNFSEVGASGTAVVLSPDNVFATGNSFSSQFFILCFSSCYFHSGFHHPQSKLHSSPRPMHNSHYIACTHRVTVLHSPSSTSFRNCTIGLGASKQAT